MSNDTSKFPKLSLGSAGLYPDVYGDFTLIPPPEGFDFMDRKPRSSVAGSDTITFDWDYDGRPTKKDYRLEDKQGNPVLDAYMLHDYGFFKGRGNEDGDQVLLVPVACPDEPDHAAQTRGIVRVYLNDDPNFRYREDVLPSDVMHALALNAQAAEMLDAGKAFRTEVREKREAAKQAVEDKAIEAAVDGTATPAETAPDKATPAIESAPAQPAAALKASAVPLTEVAADMSAPTDDLPYSRQVNKAASDVKQRPGSRVVVLGAALMQAVNSRLINEDNVAEVVTAALIQGPDPTRRISSVVIEEMRPDRWKIKLYCREGSGKGRATTSHTVHVVPAMFIMKYRVTGADKYDHHKEIKDFITACLDQVFTTPVTV